MKVFICIMVVIFAIVTLIKWDTSQPTGVLVFEDFQDITTACSKNNGVKSVSIRTENSVYVAIICNDSAEYNRTY